MVQARIGSADPIINPNFARDHLPRDGKPGFDLRVSAGTATDAEMTAMMRNEYAAGCLLSGACEVKEVIAGLRDGWDEVNWPMGQVPVMLNRLYSRYIKHTIAGKKVLEGMLANIKWHDSMNPIVLKDKYTRLEQMYAIGGFTLEEADKVYHLTTAIDQRSLYFNCIQTAWTRARPSEPTALQVIEVMSEHYEILLAQGKIPTKQAKGEMAMTAVRTQGKKCYTCGATDHLKAECPRRSARTNNGKRQGRKQVKGGQGNGDGQGKTPKRQGNCNACGQSGHWAWECPNKRVNNQSKTVKSSEMATVANEREKGQPEFVLAAIEPPEPRALTKQPSEAVDEEKNMVGAVEDSGVLVRETEWPQRSSKNYESDECSEMSCEFLIEEKIERESPSFVEALEDENLKRKSECFNWLVRGLQASRDTCSKLSVDSNEGKHLFVTEGGSQSNEVTQSDMEVNTGLGGEECWVSKLHRESFDSISGEPNSKIPNLASDSHAGLGCEPKEEVVTPVLTLAGMRDRKAKGLFDSEDSESEDSDRKWLEKVSYDHLFTLEEASDVGSDATAIEEVVMYSSDLVGEATKFNEHTRDVMATGAFPLHPFPFQANTILSQRTH